MDAKTREMIFRKKTMNAFQRVSKMPIPDKYALTVGDVLFLYQQHAEGGANGNTFFNAITAAYKMGFFRGQRAAGKGGKKSC